MATIKTRYCVREIKGKSLLKRKTVARKTGR